MKALHGDEGVVMILLHGKPLKVGDPITQDLLDWIGETSAQREREHEEHMEWVRLAGRLAEATRPPGRE